MDSDDPKESIINVSILAAKCPILYEFLLETEWLPSHLNKVSDLSLSIPKIPGLGRFKSPTIPTASFMYKPNREGSKSRSSPVPNNSNHSVILFPPTTKSKSATRSNFTAFTPEKLRRAILSGLIPNSQRAVLATVRPLRERYGDNYQSRDVLSLKNFSDESFDESFREPKCLLIDPMVPATFHALLGGLRPESQWQGVLSPISPVVLPNSYGGAQPMHVQKNRARNCPLHHDVAESSTPGQQEISNDNRSSMSIWNWDKEEPLSLLALCSCTNESLTKVWQRELKIHDSFCVQSSTAPKRANLNDIDWEAIKNGDFSSFFKDVDTVNNSSPEFSKLHFCSACGGLTYIPYSFIEICLNREMASLTDLARRLPLPVGTDIFCDGMRSTACLAARTQLHEWLIMKAFIDVDLARTVRAYEVCSMFVYPLHKPSQVTSHSSVPSTSSPCARHNMVHSKLPPHWVISDPPRLVQHSFRRPYCLRRKTPFVDGEMPSWFMERCHSWLDSQLDVNDEIKNPTGSANKKQKVSP